ncbi:hypothetical protein MJO47_09315 [Desulfuromonas sp. KJ2020]|uniref:hypothetical protein n=1 Tax=Desulfuromonas sp. KJ2020 TaxID=2919173 RepID=UPI0020A74542|nr:hypothetical protein [Desulfuromonas sp. KJ2020]MCP3177296.1 hypothetical protein [Desulfuromonas sp. KJ2020]
MSNAKRTSAPPCPVIILGSGGYHAEVDRASNALSVLDIGHYHVHKDVTFAFSEVFTGLSSGASIDYLLRTPVEGSGEVHFIWNIEGDGALEVEFFEGVGASADGTVQTLKNRNRKSAITPGSVLTKAPTGLTGLTTRLEHHRSGSTAATGRAGGELQSKHEWLLLPDTRYLLRLTSRATTLNGSIDLHIPEYVEYTE